MCATPPHRCALHRRRRDAHVNSTDHHARVKLASRSRLGFTSMAGQTNVIVTLDGERHAPGTPLLHADDLAVVRGDGIFETLLVRDGRACLVESHLQRLTQSAKLMDLPAPDLPSWRQAIDVAATAMGREQRCRRRAAVDLQPRPRRRLGADRLRDGQRATRPRRRGPPRGTGGDHAGSWAAGRRCGRHALAAGRRQDPVVRGQHGGVASRRAGGRR